MNPRFLPILVAVATVALTFSIAPVALRAQASPDASGEATPPAETTFQETVDVHLVQIPILAHDRRQVPITDLRPEDLVVRHAGQDMAVAFLEPLVPTRQAETLPDVRLHLALPGGARGDEGPSSERAAEPMHVMLYIDVENDQPLGKFHAAQALIHVVETELAPRDRVAVISYNGELELHETFTSDRQRIVGAIRQAFDRPRRPEVDLQRRIRDLLGQLEDCVLDEGGTDWTAIRRPADELCVESVAREYADEVRPRARDFLNGLDGLVRFAGGLDGRKSVIAVSHGVAVNPATEVTEAMRAIFGDVGALSSVFLDLLGGEGARLALDDVLDEAIRNEVTLHFIDRTAAPSGDYGARQGAPLMPGARPMLAAYQAAQGDLREIAATTGGLFVASPDLAEGVRRALAVERGGYVLGYYTDRHLSRASLAKVSVKSQRKGVRIRHRRGSYAQPQLRMADQGGALRGRIAVGKAEPRQAADAARVRLPFQIAVDPRDLGYITSGDQVAAQLTLHVRVEADGGRRVADAYHFVHHAYPQPVWHAGDEEPVTVDGWVEVPLGTYRLVALVRNASSGLGGQLDRTLRIASRENGARGEAP